MAEDIAYLGIVTDRVMMELGIDQQCVDYGQIHGEIASEILVLAARECDFKAAFAEALIVAKEIPRTFK